MRLGAPPETPSRVGFTLKGREYTPDDPCVFADACIRADAVSWWKHSGQWIDALSSRADTPERRKQVATLAKRHEDINQRDCSIGNCGVTVQAFVSTAQLAKVMSDSWGQPVTEVENDWGWVFPLALPIPKWFDDVKAELRSKMLAKMWPLAIIALLLLNNRRKGSWL